MGTHKQDSARLEMCSACLNPTNVFSTYELFKPGTETKIYGVGEKNHRRPNQSYLSQALKSPDSILYQSGQICSRKLLLKLLFNAGVSEM